MEVAIKSSGERPKIATRPTTYRRMKSAQQSAITNGSKLLNADGRSIWVRRCKDLIAEHLADLGGEDNTSTAERSIIRRASVVTVELERLESKFATDENATNLRDLETYQRMANTLRRLLSTLGMQRRARDVTPPSVEDYIAHINAKAAG